MWKQLWSATKGLAGSKKFQAAALSGLIWAGGKIGAHLSTEELAPIVGPLWLFIFGQGLADFGKSAAQASNPDTTAAK